VLGATVQGAVRMCQWCTACTRTPSTEQLGTEHLST
jgi:hypothetical protein